MNRLFEAGLEIQIFMQKQDWNFCFIGGLAVIRWGEPRMTQDVDICLLSGFGNEKKYIRELLKNFRSRISEAFDFAIGNRVLLLFTSNNIGIDISLSGLPFEEKMIERATPFAYTPEFSLITCSAEDLIILKAFANRAKDWMDIQGIISRQGNNLDKSHILNQLEPLCQLKDSPEIIDRIEKMVALPNSVD